MTAGTFDPKTSQEDKQCLMQILMKSSDVSNPTKSWPIYQEWITRITEEFFNQGDKERELGLPISPFCNRDGPNANSPTSSQQGFIEFIVNPLFEALECWTSLGVIRDGLDDSRERFCGVARKEQSASPGTEKGDVSLIPKAGTIGTSNGIKTSTENLNSTLKVRSHADVKSEAPK